MADGSFVKRAFWFSGAFLETHTHPKWNAGWRRPSRSRQNECALEITQNSIVYFANQHSLVSFSKHWNLAKAQPVCHW